MDIDFGEEANPINYNSELIIDGQLVSEISINGINKINPYVFYFYSKLEKITISGDIEFIGENSFSNCTNLCCVDIDGTIKSIEKDAFANCRKLTSFSFNEGLETIGDNAFSNASFEEINFPSTLTNIGETSFINNNSLTKLSINSNIEYIKHRAFYQCVNLNEVVINGKVTIIELEAFYGCIMESFLFSEGLEYIGDYAFKNTKLKEIVLPKSLIEIGVGAFMSCSDLVEISILSDMEIINTNVFYECKSLVNVHIEGTVEKIDEYAFCGCEKLESFDFNEGLTSIMSDAFEMTGFKEVILPSSLTTIGSRCFRGCNSLEKVIIPENVIEVGDFAFEKCLSLSSVEIDADSIKWGVNPFRECIYLSKVYYIGTMEDWINKNIINSYDTVYFYWNSSFVLYCQDGNLNPKTWQQIS